ncbi:MAG: SDR family oxidoreductase [Proteobacteria bacterium]|nr:SDR family oxidoreductase [Pseudomonadota bacterium]
MLADAMLADAMLEKGDMDGRAVWLRILRAVLFLVSDDASFIAGENIYVDGGNMVLQAT